MMRRALIAAAIVLAAASLKACGGDASKVGVSSLSCAGTASWTRALGGSGEARVVGIAPMPDGSFVLAGEFTDKLTMLGRDGQILERVSRGGIDGFLARVNLSGEAEWISVLGGPTHDRIRAVVGLSDGTVAVAGSIGSGGYLAPDSAPLRVPAAYEGSTGFIARYTTGGQAMSLSLLAGGLAGEVNALALASDGALLAVGTIHRPLLVAPAYENPKAEPTWGWGGIGVRGGTRALTKARTPALDDGRARWIAPSTLAGSPTPDLVGRVAFALPEWHLGNWRMPGQDPSYVPPSFAQGPQILRTDIVVAKLGMAEGVIWERRIGGAGHVFGAAVAAAPSGELFVGADLRGTIELARDGEESRPVASAGPVDALFLRLSSAGDVTAAQTIGGTALDTRLRGLAATSAGDAFLVTMAFTRGDPSIGRLSVGLARGGKIAWTRDLAFGATMDVAGITPRSDGTFVLYGAFGAGTTALLDRESPMVVLPEGGGVDGFIAFLGEDGGALAARLFANVGDERVDAVHIRRDGSLVVAGSFTGASIFALGEAGEARFVAGGGGDGFVMYLKP